MMIGQVETSLEKIAQGHIDDGLDEIQRLLEHPQMTDELRFEVSQSLYQFGFLDEAIDLLEPLQLLYADVSEISLTLAEMYLEKNKMNEALDLLTTITAEDPEFVRAVLLIAESYRLQGLYEVAEQKIRDVLESDESERSVLFSALGEIYYEQEQYTLALTAFEKGIEPAQATLADCYAHVGMFEQASESYNRALLEQESPELLFGSGFVAFQIAQWETVVERFKSLLEMDPFYASAYPFLAEAHIQLQQMEEAKQVLDQGISYDDTNPRLYELQAELLLQMGDREQAKEHLKLSLEQDPYYLASLEKMAAILKDEGELASSIMYMNEIVELNPDRADVYLDQGMLHEELEEWQLAESSYRKAIEINDQDTQALNHLAFLLRDEGKMPEALKLWGKSVHIDPQQEDIVQLLLQYDQEQ